DCFEGAVSVGLNLMHIYMDFRDDPENGTIKTCRIPYSGFLMSPYWTNPDLSDCDRILTRKYFNRNEMKSLIPSIAKELPALGRGYNGKDGRFQYMPQNWNQFQKDIYAYDEYWTRDYKTGRKL